jgi:dTDP-glucose 4,6-dehydratase
MKLLVTGAAGFIGSHFVEAAEAAGHQVEIIDCLNYAGRSKNLPQHRWAPADICDPLMVRVRFERFRPDAVVHLAAESHVARSIECRDEFLRTNVLGTNVLLEAALEYWSAEDLDEGFRFLHVSTDEVYGSLGPFEPAWTERSPYKPNNPYAASKAASDHMVRSYHRTFGLPVIITHSSNNYGPRQHPEKLIPTLIGQVMRGEPMTLHGDGLNVRDWLHVADHCAGLLAALKHGKPGETYNLGGECERTNLQIAHLVHVMTAPTTLPRINLVDNRPGNDARYATNVAKAAAELGWRPGNQIGARLAETIRWYIDNPNYADSYGR